MSRGNTIVAVGCSLSKQFEPAPAKELYLGALFKKARIFAEREGREWVILSALHGVVDPETVLDYYNMPISSLKGEDRSDWEYRVLAGLRERNLGDRLIILAGKQYYSPGLLYFLQTEFGRVDTPLKGLGIDQSMNWLDIVNAERRWI